MVHNGFTEENEELKMCEGGYDIMAVSVKSSPIITGAAAKKIFEMIKNPTDKTALFKECAELAKIFN